MYRLFIRTVVSSKDLSSRPARPRMGREVEGPAVSSPVITLPESGLFIRSEAEESHFLSQQPTSTNATTLSLLHSDG